MGFFKIKPDYDLNVIKNEIDLNGWGEKVISLSAVDLDKLKIISVEGKLSAAVSADTATALSDIVPSKDVSITRSYAVVGGDSSINTAPDLFKDGDIIHVNLDATISRNSPANNYQVTDILPAGLIPLTDVYSPYFIYSGYSWMNPFNIDGQLVSFNIWKKGDPDKLGNYSAHIDYYARVKTKGVYKAESAIVQAFEDPETINYTPAQTVTIK